MFQYDIGIHAYKCHENVYAETKPTNCSPPLSLSLFIFWGGNVVYVP
jgi:hypothetical protein